MGKLSRVGRLLLAVGLGVIVTSATANASHDFSVSVIDGTGASSAGVAPGGSIELFVNLDDDGTGIFDTFFFEMTSTEPNLTWSSFTHLADVFATGFDFTSPPGPVGGTIFEASIGGGSTSPSTGRGNLISLIVEVPLTQTIGETHFIDILRSADDIEFVFSPTALTHGAVFKEPFALNVVPEPVTLALLGVGGLVGVMRRRRR